MGLLSLEAPKDTRTEQQFVRDTVKDYFKRHKLTGKQVAKAISVSESLISLYMSGETFFSKKFAERLHKEYGFDEYFLTEGRIEIVIDQKTGENIYIEHFLFPENMYDPGQEAEEATKEEIKTEIKKMLKTLSELQKKYKDAENILYEANRTIYSIGNSIQLLEDYIESNS